MELQDSTSLPETLSRFMVWVDGVGGYMVCADETNSIGQSTQQNDVSIPICGDIHQLHANIQSVDNGHLLHPVGPVSIEQQPVTEPQLLNDNRTFCTRWEHEVILLRRDGQWHCRSFADFSIDGTSIDLEGTLNGNSRVEGRDFSFSLERILPTEES